MQTLHVEIEINLLKHIIASDKVRVGFNKEMSHKKRQEWLKYRRYYLTKGLIKHVWI